MSVVVSVLRSATVAWNQSQTIFNKYTRLHARKTLFMDAEIWISCVTKYYYYLDFFQPCKNIKTILSFRAIQKLAAGWMWPEDTVRQPLVWGATEPSYTREKTCKYTCGNKSNHTVNTGLKKWALRKHCWYLILPPIYPDHFIKLISVLVQEGQLWNSFFEINHVIHINAKGGGGGRENPCN